MSKPTLYGPGFSTYVRSCRIALAEKGAEYEMQEFNFLEGWPEGYEKRQPFMKVPAFTHEGQNVYETSAILRYIDEGFEGNSLQPSAASERAAMNCVMSIIDCYAYDALITRTFIPRAVVPMLGGETDESIIEGAKDDALKSITVLNGLVTEAGVFAGNSFSLADALVLPVLHYASQIPEGQALLADAPALSAWLGRMNERDSVKNTMPQFG
jgi:glutathione S-transferase